MSANANCVANEDYIASIKNITAASSDQITNARNRHDNSLVLIPCDALTEKEIETYESIVEPPVGRMRVTLRGGYIGDWLNPITGEDGDYYLFQDPFSGTLCKIHDYGGDAWNYYFSTWKLYEMVVREIQHEYNTRARPWVIPRLRLLLFARSRAVTSPFYKDDFSLDVFKIILRYALPAPLVTIK